jgi:anti-sigma-K factor RskA
MMGRSHEELKELLVPYALGAIPQDEMVEIRAHILECEECMAEADSFADVASSLAFAAPPEELPLGFADRVIDLVHEERPAVAPDRARGWARRWRVFEGLAFAALLIVVGVLSFALIDARRDVDYGRRVVGALLNTDQGLKLEGSGGRAAVVPADGEALFVAQGLDDVPSDRVYQLWLMRGDCASGGGADCTIVSAGTFEGRDGIALVRTSTPLDGFDDAAVTVEPNGGSDAPTTTPVISSI